MSTHVRTILERKGTTVHTVRPDQTLGEAAAVLSEHGIGALVVSSDGARVEGVISERDIVRCLGREGASCLDKDVTIAMTGTVSTCGQDATADELMALMTQSRFRHVPVVENERLAGIISIGDVVKSRMDELEVQAESLEQYVTGTSY